MNSPQPFGDSLQSQLLATATTAVDDWCKSRSRWGIAPLGETGRAELAGHVVASLWTQIEDAVLGIADACIEDRLVAEARRVAEEMFPAAAKCWTDALGRLAAENHVAPVSGIDDFATALGVSAEDMAVFDEALAGRYEDPAPTLTLDGSASADRSGSESGSQ